MTRILSTFALVGGATQVLAQTRTRTTIALLGATIPMEYQPNTTVLGSIVAVESGLTTWVADCPGTEQSDIVCPVVPGITFTQGSTTWEYTGSWTIPPRTESSTEIWRCGFEELSELANCISIGPSPTAEVCDPDFDPFASGLPTATVTATGFSMHEQIFNVTITAGAEKLEDESNRRPGDENGEAENEGDENPDNESGVNTAPSKNVILAGAAAFLGVFNLL